MQRRDFLQYAAAAAGSTLMAAGKEPVVGFATGTYGMKTMTTEEALRTIAKIGYDGVEPALMPGWSTDPAKMTPADRKALRAILAETRLAVPSMLESLPITGAPQKRAQNLERLKLDVALAHDISPSNPPMVETILGGKSTDWERLKGPMVDELKEWARLAEESKTTICFKPHAAQAVNTPERTIWLMKQVDSPRIRVVYDYSHMHVEGFTLSQSLKELLPYTAFISVKDAEGTPAKHDYLLPGDGTTDYAEYFKLLKQLRYSGYVGVEISAMIHQKPGYQPVPSTQLCYDRLAPMFERAGIRRPARKHAA